MKIIISEDPWRPDHARVVLADEAKTMVQIQTLMRNLATLQRFTPVLVLDPNPTLLRLMDLHRDRYPAVTLVVQPGVLPPPECVRYTGKKFRTLVPRVTAMVKGWYATPWYQTYHQTAPRCVRRIVNSYDLYRAYHRENAQNI